MRFQHLVGITLLLAWAPARAVAQAAPADRTHETRPMFSGVDVSPLETFDFQHHGPLEFLTYLKTVQSPFAVPEFHVGWLRPTDVRPLLDLASSHEPCAIVVMGSASTVPRERSTVGQEALFLIAGIRAGIYPSKLHSHAYNASERKALIRWARQEAR